MQYHSSKSERLALTRTGSSDDRIVQVIGSSHNDGGGGEMVMQQLVAYVIHRMTTMVVTCDILHCFGEDGGGGLIGDRSNKIVLPRSSRLKDLSALTYDVKRRTRG